MIDPAFDCNVNRTNGDPTTQLYLINHFLDKPVSIIADGVVPDKDRLNQTNAAEGFGSLGLHAEQCGAQHGRSPNFLLVDVSVFFLNFNSFSSPFFVCHESHYLYLSAQFYEYGGGSVFQVAANLNGVEYNPTRPIATPIPDGTGTSTATSNAALELFQIPEGLWASLGTALTGLVLGISTVL